MSSFQDWSGDRLILMGILPENIPINSHLVANAAASGVDVIYVRTGRSMEPSAQQPQHNLPFIMNSRLKTQDNALILNGWHFSESRINEIPPSRSEGKWIGASVHSLEKAMLAQALGADYLIVGTIFSSGSHPDISPKGTGFLSEVCRNVKIPVIAIGGITPENCAECISCGASGVAVLSGIFDAPNIEIAASQFRNALDLAALNRTGKIAQ